ncbi:NUDIX hydrolase [Phytoactinopolyspora alkaliphila]|uniref:NUDIX hydrolase n=1 Tax=Phytoactinopolyspora alkaliphila TaxID=1783498 RepID=A0A6N9YS66_9ACTN|nr:NUDIX hydrolase [Phytoactinopolyspora alkaliphila]
MEKKLRVAAYAVCISDGQVLLARYVSPDRAEKYWTLPGGGVDHDEDPYRAVVREVAEETGYDARIEQLLGVDSRSRRVTRDGTETDMHLVGIYYRARVIGGELTHEIDGSTDLAAWVPLSEVKTLERAALVDTGLALVSTQPLDGHVPPTAVDGLVRD